LSRKDIHYKIAPAHSIVPISTMGGASFNRQMPRLEFLIWN
jgi:hypothetical protein